jgi:hypothetical protein
MTGEEQSFSLWVPLLFAGIAFAVLRVAAGIMAGRGREAGAERLLDLAFLLVLLGGVWVVILVLITLVDMPDEVWDMVVITLVVAVFFVLLLLAFFALSLLFGAIGRAVSRRKRVTTSEL